MNPQVTPEIACGWLREQIDEIGLFRNANTRDAQFKHWRQNTLTLIQRIWPGVTAKSRRFRRVPFGTPSTLADSRQTREAFERGCAEAQALLRDWVTEIERKGVVSEQPDAPTEATGIIDGSPTLELGGEAPPTPPPAEDTEEHGVRSVDLPRIEEQAAAGAEPKSPPKPAKRATRTPRSPAGAKTAGKSKATKKAAKGTRLKDMLGLGHLAAATGGPDASKIPGYPLESADPAAEQESSRDPEIRVVRGVAPDEAPVEHGVASLTDASAIDAPDPAVPMELAESIDALPITLAIATPRDPADGSENPSEAVGRRPAGGFVPPVLRLVTPEFVAERSADLDPGDPGLEEAATADDGVTQDELAAAEAIDFSDLELTVVAEPDAVSASERDAEIDAAGAAGIAMIAAEIEGFDVPAAERDRVQRALLELAMSFERGEVTWEALRSGVSLAMGYPRLARAVLPVLVPLFERAA